MCELRVMGFFIYLVLALARGLPVEDPILPLKTSDVKSDQEGENSGHSVEIIPATSIEFDGSPFSFDHGLPSRGNADHSVELEAGSQVYFPSFASLFEPRQSLRLNYPNQEGAFSQRPNSYRALLNNNNFPIFNPSSRTSDKPFGKYTATPDASNAILGSGNFAVIPGGTFFARNDEDGGYGFDSFYNNGHGGPSPYFNNPSPNYNQDQFANFRDFAEINTPANSAYSHFVVVYANKNGTVESVKDPSKTTTNEPRNIIETLTLLDNDRPADTTPWPAVAETAKLSKTKAKLASTKLETKKWKLNSKNPSLANKVEFDEPLLALS